MAPLFPVYQGDRLLAALCTGVFGGIGYAIIYTRNSSTGGSDFIIMAVKALKPHLSLGNIAFLSDGKELVFDFCVIFAIVKTFIAWNYPRLSPIIRVLF